MTEREKALQEEIVERYCSQYPFGRKVEDFGVYDAEEADVILSGSTKLPGTSASALFEAGNYWLKCLTEITHLLSNAVWDVTFDDVDLIYDREDGWRFPTDEEYPQRT